MTQDKQLESAAIEFAKKRLVFTDEFVDYNQEMYAAFKAGAQFQLENKQVGAIWVKASERIQNTDADVFLKGCRIDKGKLVKIKVGNKEYVALIENGRSISEWELGHEQLKDIYWLNEHPQQPTLEAISAMAEKIYWMIDESVYDDTWHDRYDYEKAIMDERNAFIKGFTSALGYSAGDGWISCDERLPENNDNVLIFANKTGEQTEVAFYDDNDKEWCGLNDFWLRYITHWQQLPKPPQK